MPLWADKGKKKTLAGKELETSNRTVLDWNPFVSHKTSPETRTHAGICRKPTMSVYDVDGCLLCGWVQMDGTRNRG
jgi:hypothetical protein